MDPLPLLLMLVVIPIGKGQDDDSCSVDPKDQYIEVGSSTEVVCKTSCVHGETFWTLDDMPVDESWSRTFNSTHVVLTLRNFTRHRATVACRTVDTQHVVGGIIIVTYTRPRNLSCILHYDDENRVGMPQFLTCSWEHQMFSRVNVNYSILYSSALHTSPIEICKSKVTTCKVRDFYTSEQIGLYVGENFSVAVRARTRAWEAYSDSYELNPYQIWKINPPKISVATFSDHLLVEWSRSYVSEEHLCQVKFRKAPSADERTAMWIFNKTLNTEQNVKIPLEAKHGSCTNYKLSVRCALDKAPWSDWSPEKTVLTKLNKSQIRLRLWRKVTEVQSDGVRKICAMWTEIPSACPGRFTYEVKQTPDQKDVIQGSQISTSCGRSTCDITVNQDAHRINLTVSLNKVLLAEDSVYVPAVGESLPRVTDIQTSTRDGVILVNWRAPNQSVRGYMIDWTHNGNQYYWKESKYTKANLFDLLDKKPYNITVTPLFDDKTGHGTQVLQICSRVGDPGNVAISSVQAYDKSADVSWETHSDWACSSAFVSYTLFYGTQEGWLLNITVGSEKQNIMLKDLNPDTQYKVYIEATALTGTITSRERLFKTNRFDPNLITVLTVCGCLIIVLVLFLGLCCAVQWKRFRDRPVPNPGLSSVASWSSSIHHKNMCLFHQFSDPSESTFDKVYTEQTTNSSTPSLAISSNGRTAGYQSGEYADSAMGRDEKLADPVSILHPCFSEETTAFFPSESSPGSPYRRQTSVETQTSKTGKQCKRVSGKEQEKTSHKTVYVTLDMFESDQAC